MRWWNKMADPDGIWMETESIAGNRRRPGGPVSGVVPFNLEPDECVIAAHDAHAGRWRCLRTDPEHMVITHRQTQT